MPHFLYPVCPWTSKLVSRVLTHNIGHYSMPLLFPKEHCFHQNSHVLRWYLGRALDRTLSNRRLHIREKVLSWNFGFHSEFPAS